MKKIFTILGMVAITATVSAQTNLIPNPGFESWTAGAPDSWFIPTNATVAQSTTVMHSGASSLSLTAPSSSNRTISPTTDTTIDPAKTYVFSGWYLDNDATARFRYWNQWRTATGDTGTNSLQASDYSTDSPQWVFFTAEGTPNATATVARPGLRIYPETATTGGGVIYFDDISFYDKATLSVMDVQTFDKNIVMNTLVEDQITFKLPMRSTVNIYTMEGRLVSSDRVSDGQSLQASQLESGYYIVTVDNGTAKISRKILKK